MYHSIMVATKTTFWFHCNCNINPVVILLDLWFWGLQVPDPHNSHVVGGHVSLDGSGGDPEPACVWDLWHVLLWRGEWHREREDPQYLNIYQTWVQFDSSKWKHYLYTYIKDIISDFKVNSRKQQNLTCKHIVGPPQIVTCKMFLHDGLTEYSHDILIIISDTSQHEVTGLSRAEKKRQQKKVPHKGLKRICHRRRGRCRLYIQGKCRQPERGAAYFGGAGNHTKQETEQEVNLEHEVRGVTQYHRKHWGENEEYG